jgi:hypothetical protein
MGDPGNSAVVLAVLVLATVAEMGFARAWTERGALADEVHAIGPTTSPAALTPEQSVAGAESLLPGKATEKRRDFGSLKESVTSRDGGNFAL